MRMVENLEKQDLGGVGGVEGMGGEFDNIYWFD